MRSGISLILSLSLSLTLAAPALAQLGDAGKLLPVPPAADPSFQSNYGQVAMDGNFAVASDSLSSPLRFGFVHVFERTSTGWQLVAELQDPSPMLGVDGYFSEFGLAIDISGTTIVVSNTYHSTGLKENPPCCADQRLGIVHVYEHQNQAWTLTDSITPPDAHPGQQFGRNVALQGDTLFTSRFTNVDPQTSDWFGEVFQYARSGTSWGLADSFFGPNAAPSDLFGSVMAIGGDTFLVNSDPSPEDPTQNIQTIHAYKNIGSSWTYAGDLTPSSIALDSAYGIRLAVQDNYAAVGAPSAKGKGNKTAAGAVHIFVKDAADNWVETQILTAGDPSSNAQFGRALDFDAHTLLVGSPYDDTLGNNAGSVYHFELWGGLFNEIAKLVPGDNAPGDEFGTSLAISRGNAMVTAPLDDDAGLNFGSIYLYDCGDDTDEDGLCDDWETLGVPYYDSDGVLQRYLLDIDGNGTSDANPLVKDLFVEIDSMAGVNLPPSVTTAVAEAFDFAPVSNGPGQPEGIRLHFDIDQSNLPFEHTVTTKSGWPDNYDGFRFGFFGTLADQSDPNAEGILGARAKAFRYCVVANFGEFLDENNDPAPFGGLAELPGDDMVLYIGGEAPEDSAAALMHELGHSLGLGHGGGDSINNKPNYPSIMNYIYAYKSPWSTDFWTMDYCQEKLSTLRETNLDETTPPFASTSGIYADHCMPFAAVVAEGVPCWISTQHGEEVVEYLSLDPTKKTDFNLDCDTDDTGVMVDLNKLADDTVILPGTPDPKDILVGNNDWATLYLPVTDGGGPANGPLPRSPEPSFALRDLIRTAIDPPTPDCPADLNADDILDNGDIGAFITLFLAGDLAADFNGDGFLDNGDINAFIALFIAGC